MNLATSTTSTTWNAVKRHHLLAFAGASLALAAIVAGSAIGTIKVGNSTDQGVSTQPHSRIAPVTIPPAPVMTYYLVGSEEQRQAAEAEAQWRVEDNAMYYPEKSWKFGVILAGTLEAETDALAMLDEVKARWTAAGASGLEVIDLRQQELRHTLVIQRTPILLYLVESQARATDILAAAQYEAADRESADSYATYFAFKATTAEEEARVAEFVETLRDWNVQVIDLRSFGPIE